MGTAVFAEILGIEHRPQERERFGRFVGSFPWEKMKQKASLGFIKTKGYEMIW